jgi:hypothetical protein
MRWDRLFGDLDAQWDAEVRRELDEEVSDRTRRERATVGMYERLAANAGGRVGLQVISGESVEGSITDVGRDWVLLASGVQRSILVPLGAIVTATGVPSRAGGSAVGKRFGLGYALRGLSRDRAVVALVDVTGTTVTGTIDAVGSDVLDLSEHPPDLPRRPEHVTAERMVPFAAIAVVRSA